MRDQWNGQQSVNKYELCDCPKRKSEVSKRDPLFALSLRLPCDGFGRLRRFVFPFSPSNLCRTCMHTSTALPTTSCFQPSSSLTYSALGGEIELSRQHCIKRTCVNRASRSPANLPLESSTWPSSRARSDRLHLRPRPQKQKWMNASSPETFASDVQTVSDQPAAAAVLNTNELLQQILSEIPCEHRVNLRRVSKTCNEVVSKAGYAVEPVCVRPSDELYENRTYYPNHLTFRCHPAIDYNFPRRDHIIDSMQKRSMMRMLSHNFERFWIREPGIAQEFITNPPITQIGITPYTSVLPTIGILRVPEGIRLVHLHDTFTRMSGAQWDEGDRTVRPTFADLMAEFWLSKKYTSRSGITKYYYCSHCESAT